MKKKMKYDEIFITPRNQMNEIMKTVIEKCQDDKDFEQRLLNNPTEIMQLEGVEVKEGFNFQIVKSLEDLDSLPTNIIPLPLVNQKCSLSLEDLDKVAGGVGGWDPGSVSGSGHGNGYWNSIYE